MDAVNLELMELVATGGKQGDVAANILKPIHVNADTLKPRVMDLGFDTSTEAMLLLEQLLEQLKLNTIKNFL